MSLLEDLYFLSKTGPGSEECQLEGEIVNGQLQM